VYHNSGPRPTLVPARSYHDTLLDHQMVLCVIPEETEEEIVVVTCYKSSKLARDEVNRENLVWCGFRLRWRHCALEILDASKHVQDPLSVTLGAA